MKKKEFETMKMQNQICSECSKTLRDFVSHRLNNREKMILKEMGENNGQHSMTKFVHLLSKKYNISRTCVWYNIRKMRDSGLIVFGNRSVRGTRASLTEFGLLIQTSSILKDRMHR
jgi:predicted transcriptional regulator